MRNLMQQMARGLDAKVATQPKTAAGNFSTLKVIVKVLTGAVCNVDLYAATQDAISENPSQIISPVVTKYRFACQYFTSNPSMLRAIKFQSNETDTSAPLLLSLDLTPTRNTPFGLRAENGIPLITFKSSGQFQNELIDAPINTRLSGFDYLHIGSDYVATQDTIITMLLLIDQRVEAADQLADPTALVMLGAGGVPVDAVQQAQNGGNRLVQGK